MDEIVQVGDEKTTNDTAVSFNDISRRFKASYDSVKKSCKLFCNDY